MIFNNTPDAQIVCEVNAVKYHVRPHERIVVNEDLPKWGSLCVEVSNNSDRGS